MNTPPRNLPRFMPTLTEVVHLPPLPRTVVLATPDLEKTVGLVMQQVNLVLDRRLREEADSLLRTVVAEQMQTLSVRLRQEMEDVVRQAVSEVLTSGVNRLNPK